MATAVPGPSEESPFLELRPIELKRGWRIAARLFPFVLAALVLVVAFTGRRHDSSWQAALWVLAGLSLGWSLSGLADYLFIERGAGLTGTPEPPKPSIPIPSSRSMPG